MRTCGWPRPSWGCDVRIQFTVFHLPVARPRQRVGVRAGHAVTYTKREHPIHGFKAAVATATARAIKAATGRPYLECFAARVDILFAFPGPTSAAKNPKPKPMTRHVKKPDRDNLDKAVLDAVKALWRDDSLVTDGEPIKRRAGLNCPSRVEIIITPLSEDDDATVDVERLGFTLYPGERAAARLV